MGNGDCRTSVVKVDGGCEALDKKKIVPNSVEEIGKRGGCC